MSVRSRSEARRSLFLCILALALSRCLAHSRRPVRVYLNAAPHVKTGPAFSKGRATKKLSHTTSVRTATSRLRPAEAPL